MNTGNHNNYGSIDGTGASSSSFSPTEFLILKEQIFTNLVVIKKNSSKLDKVHKLIGSKNDGPELRNKIQSIQKATNENVKTTSALIKKLNSIIRFSSTEKAQKIQSEKLISEFHLVVQKFLQSEKSLNSKIRKALLVNVNDEDDLQQPQASSSSQQQLLAKDLRFENELALEREQNINKIEDDVQEIAQIMSEISTLIHSQSDNIETIENQVADVESNVEQGEAELQKASSYQQRIRKKSFLIFIIILIVALIVGFSVYSKM